MARNGEKWWKMARNGEKQREMVRSSEKWWEAARNGEKQRKMVRSSGKWWEMVRSSGKWWEMVRNGGKWWKMVKNSEKWRKNGERWWETVITVRYTSVKNSSIRSNLISRFGSCPSFLRFGRPLSRMFGIVGTYLSSSASGESSFNFLVSFSEYLNGFFFSAYIPARQRVQREWVTISLSNQLSVQQKLWRDIKWCKVGDQLHSYFCAVDATTSPRSGK